MVLKSKLFVNGSSYANFLNTVLPNFTEGKLEEETLYYVDKHFRYDSYSNSGFKYDRINIEGPVVFEYKMNTKLEMLENLINQFVSELPSEFSCVFIIYEFSEQNLSRIKLPNNAYVLGIETILKWTDEFFIDYIKSQGIDRLYNNSHVNKIQSSDFLKNSKLVLNRLHTDICESNFSIVLGAGVSLDYGALSWEKLIASFERELEETVDIKFISNLKTEIGATDLISAQLYKELLKDRKFYNRIYSSLYSDFDESKLKKGTTLYEVARLLEEYSEGKNITILTYNFDNFLELYLENYFKLVKYKVIYNEKNIPNSVIPIYHIHGYLPYDKEISQSFKESIVLTEDNYNYLYNSPYSWQIGTQMESFRKNNCLFIGCSLTDPNIRRLLKLSMSSNKKNYALMCMKKLTEFELTIITKHFSNMGVEIIWTESYKEYPKIINSLYC
ncbi:SIR2 family protein [uncultured Granulicatella sp.]|uniref:SIR2 family protein n=1 Tax=uncultured Granulicatella sp. TaxID=316089 RepID=UPI002628BB76|nr:SIR2 family protein [uncultured Granulicatella sp.]